LPIFGLSKAFDLGRGIKVFLNLQTGATRGSVPDPWHRRNSSKTLKRKDQEIYRLRKQVKKQGEDLFQLRNDFRVANELAEDAQGDPSALWVSNEEVGALPDFVVIGAMRCGTSRFYKVFTKHSHVQRAAAKELHYFDQLERFERGIEWYRRCFPPPEQKDGQRTITGEATPMYLFDPLVPERMARAVPQTRLIVLLRNPVDRAYSHYHKRVRESGQETPSFEETVEEELAWLNEGKIGLSSQERRPEAGHGSRYNQLARGIYVDQLVRWRQFFDEEQMLVLKSEDFFKHTADILKQVQTFLGLPYKEIKLPPRQTKRKSTYEYEPMDPALRQQLEVFFEPHNRRLYDYLNRDFGW
jgi:hypothetical protein